MLIYDIKQRRMWICFLKQRPSLPLFTAEVGWPLPHCVMIFLSLNSDFHVLSLTLHPLCELLGTPLCRLGTSVFCPAWAEALGWALVSSRHRKQLLGVMSKPWPGKRKPQLSRALGLEKAKVRESPKLLRWESKLNQVAELTWREQTRNNSQCPILRPREG